MRNGLELPQPPILDLEEIKNKWLRVCPACDGGLPANCTHPDEDYRPVMALLVQRLEYAEMSAPTDSVQT